MDLHGIFKSYSIIQRENPRRTVFIAELLEHRSNYIWQNYRWVYNDHRWDRRQFVLRPTDTMEVYKRMWTSFERRPEVKAKLQQLQQCPDDRKRSKARRQWYESWLRDTFGGQLWAKILLSAGTVHVGKFHWD